MTETKETTLTETQRALFEAAQQARECPLEEILAPNWEASRRFRWTYYVLESASDLWEDLPLEAKLIAYSYAVESLSADDPDRGDFL